MNPTSPSTDSVRTEHTADSIASWLRSRLAGPLKLASPDAIDLQRSAEDLALDSMIVVRLAGELEERLGIELEPSLIYEFESLAAYVRQLEVMHRKSRERRGDQGHPISLALAATFTAEPVGEALTFGLGRLGFSPSLTFAPYHQVFQELLNPAGVLGANDGGVNLVLVRVEDWFRFESAAVPTDKALSVVAEFVDALTTHAAAAKS